MDSGQTNKCPCSENKCPDRNVRRREHYKLKIANEKSALSLQEVLKNQALQRNRFERETSIISTDLTTTSAHLQCTSNTKGSYYTSKTDSRVVLTTKNDFVNEINDILIAKFPEKATIFIGIDETIEPNNQSQFEDLLHTLNPAGLPPYKLTLKENYPIILLRNLNPYEGLCNGTRLICCDIKTHVISAKIATGDFKNKHVFIPRIPLLSSQDERLPVQFKRTQFPVRLCYAMTINKAQGQTLDFVGIYL